MNIMLVISTPFKAVRTACNEEDEVASITFLFELSMGLSDWRRRHHLSSKTQKKKQGSEHLQRIIDLSKAVEERGLDPFQVEVDDLIAVVRDLFPEWDSMDEFSLDAEAVNRLASIIKLQGEWVKHRSTSLYTDPFLIEEKLRKLSREDIARMFLNTWHPIVEFEQISSYSLIEAVKYWQSLLPLDERWTKTSGVKTELGATSRDELIMQRIMSEKAFTEDLEALWRDLRDKVGGSQKILYWEFVGADTYEETSRRAYMTSFLVTYGYATFEVHRLEEEIYIIPFDKPRSLVGKKQLVSVPVSVSYEEWKRWKEHKHD